MNGTMEETVTNSPSDAQPASTPAADVIFDHGLPGFPAARRFSLTGWGSDDGPFSLMSSLDDQTEFLVAVPEAFFPDYEPEIDDETAEWLGITSSDDAVVLVIISVPDKPENATANLLGPLIVNRHTRRAVQTVLSEGWSTRQPLFQPLLAASR